MLTIHIPIWLTWAITLLISLGVGFILGGGKVGEDIEQAIADMTVEEFLAWQEWKKLEEGDVFWFLMQRRDPMARKLTEQVRQAKQRKVVSKETN